MDKINIRNVYIDLLNKIKGVEGVDKDYVDNLIEVVDRHLTALDYDLSLIVNLIPESASVTNPLVTEEDLPAAQVNADWNASSGVAQILNKPTIPAAQVNADWNASSGVAQILNKPAITTFNTSLLNIDVNWYGPDQTGYVFTYFDISGVIDDTKTAWINLIPVASDAISPSNTEKANYNLIVGNKIEQYSANVIRIWLYATSEPTATYNIQFNYYT